MRRLLVAGNWKMNTTRSEARELAEAVAVGLGEFDDLEIALFPPYPYLQTVAEMLGTGPVGLGAQNLYYERAGAFTGEVSGPMLADVGCRYAIVGHSERRHILGEDDAMVGRKVHAALDAGLHAVLCVGELLEEREAGRTAEVVHHQVKSALAGVSAEQMPRVTIAYEPVWAIGTGRTATPDQAQAVHADLRNLLATVYNAQVAEEARIVYGGSVKPDNARSLLEQVDLDGALVGGASLDADAFLEIVSAARSAMR